MKDLIKLVVIIPLVTCFLILTIKKCKSKQPNTITVIDSVEVIKTIPAKENTFKLDSLKEVKDKSFDKMSKFYQKRIKELREKYKNESDNTKILQDLLQATRKRKYNETFKDSTINAEVTAYTTGTLDSLIFNYKIKEQKVKFFERTKTIKQLPRYRVYLGLDLMLQTKINDFKTGLNLGLQTRKGDIYNLSFYSDNSIMFGYKTPLFTRW